MANLIFTWVKNYLGEKFYPYTHTDAVYVDDTEEKNLTKALDELTEKIDYVSEAQTDWDENDDSKNTYIKNKPLSLPANGGNADTLDGKHASDFAAKISLDEHLTNTNVHQQLFDEKLNINTANRLIKDVSSDASTGVITVTRLDNTTFTINIPKSLILKSSAFNESTNEIVITWSDDSESRIPVEGLVDVYSGSEGDAIQIAVDDNNIISAIIKEGSINQNLLSNDIQNILNSSYEHISNAEEHIPNGGISGQVVGMTDTGVEWIDINKPENYITETDFATIEKPGLIKPDGYTIVCNKDGTINTQYIKTIDITSGTDLDTILSPGFYCCQTTAIATSLLNCPVKTPFSLIVRYATGTAKSSALQELTTYTVNNPKTYKRSIYHDNNGSQHAVGEWCLVYDENNRPPINSTTSYYSIVDLGMDASVKYTTMDIFDNLPSRSILYLGDCSNVQDPPAWMDNPSITIYKIMGNASYAMAVSRRLTDTRMAYKIFRSNDPKGDSEWVWLYTNAEATPGIGSGGNTAEISFDETTSKLIIGEKEIDLSSLKNSEILNGGGEITPGFNNNMIWKNYNTEGVTLNRVDYLNDEFIAIGGTYVFHGTEMPLQKINLQDFAEGSTFTLVNVHFYFNSYYMIALGSNNGTYTSYIFRTEDLVNFEVKILEGKKILGLYFNGSTYSVLDETGNYVYLRNAGEWENFNIDSAYIVNENYISGYIDWIVNSRFISSFSVTTKYFYSDSEWIKGSGTSNNNGFFLINKTLYRWFLSNNVYSIYREELGMSNTVWTCPKEVGDKMKFRIGTMCNGKLLLIFGGKAVLINSFDELDNIVDNGYNDIFTIHSSNIKFIVHNYEFMLATTESGELIYAKIS